MSLGDVNQDGKLDVVTALMSGEVGVWLNPALLPGRHGLHVTST